MTETRTPLRSASGSAPQVDPSAREGVTAGEELLYDYCGGDGERPLDFVLRYGFCPRCDRS